MSLAGLQRKLAAADVLGLVRKDARSRQNARPLAKRTSARDVQESLSRRVARATLACAILIAILVAAFALRAYVYVRLP